MEMEVSVESTFELGISKHFETKEMKTNFKHPKSMFCGNMPDISGCLNWPERRIRILEASFKVCIPYLSGNGCGNGCSGSD